MPSSKTTPSTTMLDKFQDLFDYNHFNYYMMRIKKESITQQMVYDTIKELGFSRIIVSNEISADGDTHQHVMMGTIEKYNIEDVRKSIKSSFNVDGNKEYSLKFCVSPIQAIKYTIKEGSYIQFGFRDEAIEFLSKLSYKKFDKVRFMSELSEIEFKFRSGMIKKRQFYDLYVDLRLSYGQNYPATAQLSYVRRMFCLVDADYKKELNDFYYNKLFS